MCVINKANENSSQQNSLHPFLFTDKTVCKIDWIVFRIRNVRESIIFSLKVVKPLQDYWDIVLQKNSFYSL